MGQDNGTQASVARPGTDTGAADPAAPDTAPDTPVAAPAEDAADPAAAGPRPGRTRRVLRRARRTVTGWGHYLRTHPYRAGTAVASGLLLAVAFPPFDLWWLSIPAVAAFSVVVHHRRPKEGFGLGFLFGFPFMVLLLNWLSVIGWDAVIGLSLIEAMFVAALGAALAVTSRLPLWPLWTACLWVAEEFARDRVPFGGFPWGRLAFANTASPYTPLAAIGGAPAVTFAVALSAALLACTALALAERPARARGIVVASGAVLLAVAVPATAYAVPIPTAGQTKGGPAAVDVAVIQGNVPRIGLDFLGQRRAVLDNHVRETRKLADDIRAGRVAKPDLVIWPENSSDVDPFEDPVAYQEIDDTVKYLGIPVLTGVLVNGPDANHIQNEGIVWDPVTGPGASYTKRHPVPFGEYIPFRDVLTKVISRLKAIPRDFYFGKHVGVLQLGPARIGDVICFEVAYDNITREAISHGGRVLVVQTNNATYGRTGQPEQQLAMSRLRAVETGRSVLIAATSGISAVIRPDGTIEKRTKEFTADYLTATVPLRDDLTLATRVGAAPEWIVSGIGVLACALAVATRRRNRGAVTGTTDTTEENQGKTGQ